MSGDWRARAACARPGTDPAWWDSAPGGDSGNPGRHNRIAVDTCHTCPVRVDCRDDALAYIDRGNRLVATIVGGWRFDTHGRPRPHPDDWDLAEARAELRRQELPPRGGAKPQPDRARNYLAAGRAVLGGEDPEVVAARHGLATSTIRQAASLVRFAPPGLLDQVEAGQKTTYQAVLWLRTSGRAAGWRAA